MLDPRLIAFLRRAALRAGRPGPATTEEYKLHAEIGAAVTLEFSSAPGVSAAARPGCDADPRYELLNRPLHCMGTIAKRGVVVVADNDCLPEWPEVTVFAPEPSGSNARGILAITPVSPVSVVRPSTTDDDVLAEIAEGHA